MQQSRYGSIKLTVIVLCGTAGKGRVEHDDTVVLLGLLVVRREGGVAKETFTGAGGKANSVDVERVLLTLTESLLHVGLLLLIGADVREPVSVERASGVLENEGDAGGVVVGVEDVDLLDELRISVE
jgi:hypothetical protein